MPANAERATSKLIASGIAALLAWTTLVVAAPTGVAWICGPGGLVRSLDAHLIGKGVPPAQ